MNVIPEKIEYKNVSREHAIRFAGSISEKGLAKRVTTVLASDKSHLDRYGYVHNNRKVSVVYDLKARLLSISACDDIISSLKNLFNQTADIEPSKKNKDQSSQKKSNAQKLQSDVNNKNSLQNQKLPKTKNVISSKQTNAKSTPTAKHDETSFALASGKIKEHTQPQKTNAKKFVKADEQNNTPTQKQNFSSLPNVSTKNDAKPTPNAKHDETDDSGGLTIKKFTAERFSLVLKKIGKEKRRYKLSLDSIIDKDKPTQLDSYLIKGDAIKIRLRYMPKKNILQLQGKHGELFNEIRLLLFEQTDYRSAVDAQIQQEQAEKGSKNPPKSSQKAVQVERQLKKLIPSAFRFLSEQSKIDFTIGIIEILNSKQEHYDYSMLLLPPFRGLERLIFDLQKAQNVVVKMIGQAYEKENGMYVLKESYRRKIDSIVYCEVMASLYREYFDKRNYYAHSDSTGGDNRRIQSRSEVQEVFTNLLQKIEYNCKKLTEIRFSI